MWTSSNQQTPPSARINKVTKGIPSNRDQLAKRRLDWQASGHPHGVYLIDKITQARSFGALKTTVYNQFATFQDMCAYLDEVEPDRRACPAAPADIAPCNYSRPVAAHTMPYYT